MKTAALIMTCYNHQRFIADAFKPIIASKKSLHQLIVCDDCSTDDSRSILDEQLARIDHICIKKVYNETNLGLNATLNKAFRLINADVILIQSCDDLSSEDRISHTIKFFSNHCYVDFAISSYTLINETGALGATFKRSGYYSNFRALLRKGSSLPLYGMSFTKKFLDNMGYLPESITNEDDYIGFFAVSHYGIHCIPAVLYYYRIHKGSMSNWTLSNDKRIIESNFYYQQFNRIANFTLILSRLNESWESTLSNVTKQRTCVNLLKKRVELHKFYLDIHKTSFASRLSLLFRYHEIVSVRDFFILLLGLRSLGFIRTIKKCLHRL
jgi:glycosyltransferase involved in cell wall biosynthesis